MNLPILLRPMEDSDRSFVLSSWLRSYAFSEAAEEAGKEYWRYHDTISRMVDECWVSVCALEEDPEVIVGWSCTEPPHVLHYVYVKQDFRRMGIMRRLTGHLRSKVIYTHKSRVHDKATERPVERRMPAEWTYDRAPICRFERKGA